MNYVFIAEDKNGKDTCLVKKISDDCYLKITEIYRNNSNTPCYEILFVNEIRREPIWADTMIDDEKEVEQIESRIIAGFRTLFGQFIFQPE